MQSFTHLLRLMTKDYNLTTLLVNTSVKVDTNTKSAFSATKVKPALGVSWTFTADTCILMHRSVEEDMVITEVLRSRNGVMRSLVVVANSRNAGGFALTRRPSPFGNENADENHNKPTRFRTDVRLRISSAGISARC